MARNSKYDRNKQTRETKAPALIAYAVTEKGEGESKQSFWNRIGAAWEHEDGAGLTLQLDLVPVNGGRIVLRSPKEADENGKGAQ